MSDTEPIDEHGIVRFETQCVVIPNPHRARLPRVVTKSYSLPLSFKRRAVSEDASLILRVPTLSLKPHSHTHSADLTPLPPCLVHAPEGQRHVRSPRKPSPSPSRSDIVTVPLRPCCAACQSVTEAALNDRAWPEHFSRAASRQRSRSIDDDPRTLTVAGSAASASYGTLGVSIHVDEIDKRQRASDSRLPKPHPDTLLPVIDIARTSSSSCRVPSSEIRPPPSPSRITPSTPRIPEESDDDESELFPLPSPKRTLTTSPAPSFTGSFSSLTVSQPQQSCGSGPPSTCSGDSAKHGSNTTTATSNRYLLAPPPCASSSSLSLPKLSGSTADLSSSFARDGDPKVAPVPRAPSPDHDMVAPLPSRMAPCLSAEPYLSLIPPTPTDRFPPAENHLPKPKRASMPVFLSIPSSLAPSPAQSPQSVSQMPPLSSPTRARFALRSKRAVSMDLYGVPPQSSPSTHLGWSSPTSPTSHAKTRFSITRPLRLFADALRGVGVSSTSSRIVPGL